MEKEFKYNLIDGFEYASKGITKKANYLTIKAPKMKIARYTATLEREFFKAMENVPKNDVQAKNTKSETLKASDYTMLLSAYGDIQNCYEALSRILTECNFDDAVCKIDDVEKMTDILLAEISLVDIKNILGEYFKNFLLSSLQV